MALENEWISPSRVSQHQSCNLLGYSWYTRSTSELRRRSLELTRLPGLIERFLSVFVLVKAPILESRKYPRMQVVLVSVTALMACPS